MTQPIRRKRTKREPVALSEDAAKLIDQMPESKDLPILSNEQIEGVAERFKRRLKQRVGQARAEAWRKQYEQMYKSKRVSIGSGLEGVLTVAGQGTPEVSFFEILVNGERFFGVEEERMRFEEYLDAFRMTR